MQGYIPIQHMNSNFMARYLRMRWYCTLYRSWFRTTGGSEFAENRRAALIRSMNSLWEIMDNAARECATRITYRFERAEIKARRAA